MQAGKKKGKTKRTGEDWMKEITARRDQEEEKEITYMNRIHAGRQILQIYIHSSLLEFWVYSVYFL